ncbi:hypothetical protein ACFLR1_06255 [Bacteroidota bacterium]
MKRALIIVLIGTLLAGGIAYYMYNKPHRDVASEEALFVTTANQIFDEFEANETDANTKYLDKTIQVTGAIAEIGLNDVGKSYVILAADNAMIGGVSATFEEEIDNLSVGNELSVKGRCTGMLMDVVMINCTLVE